MVTEFTRPATWEDLKRLGYPNPREFRREWPNDRMVWLVTFELVTQDEPKPRYLAPATGYTTNRHRATDDLECVDAFTQKRLSDEAHDRDHRRNDERRSPWFLRRHRESISDHRRARADRASRVLGG